jgi:diguanylate cyclase (GGDEF)-like protein
MGRPACLLMLDVDHFKMVNDTYGHAAGDKVLAAVGQALRDRLRQIDICGRLGGEEFAVLLIETGLTGAAITAERLRALLAAMEIDYLGRSITFTVSIGCTSLRGGTVGLDDALGIADQLMYRAKQAGRNRVMSDPREEVLA